MEAKNDAYLLVVFDSVEDTEPVRDLFCRVAEIHPTDAMQWVARMPGIGLRPLPKVQIEPLLEGLYDLGIAAEARSAAAIPSLYPPRNAHDVACLPEGLRVKGLRGEPIHWVPWPKVELVHAGWVEQADETRAIGAAPWISAMRNALNTMLGRPRMVLGRRERTMRIPREPRREIILVRAEPRIAMRLAEDALNYQYLGPKLKPTAGENFPLLLNDLCARVDPAAITKSTKSLLKGEPRDETSALFPTSQALLDDSIVRLLWRWYQNDRRRDLDESDGDEP